jgi:hypothetical protein
MKKIYFYTSILLLFVLVWLNKENTTEGARGRGKKGKQGGGGGGRGGGGGGRGGGGGGRGGGGGGRGGRGGMPGWMRKLTPEQLYELLHPPKPIRFVGLSAENLHDIYRAIDQKTEKKKEVYASNAAAKIAKVVAQTQKTMADAAASFEFEDSEEPDPYMELPPKIEILDKTCPTKEEVIKQLIELNVNDDKFNEMIDRKDKNYAKAYKDLMIQLKFIPTINWSQRFKKPGHKTHSPPVSSEAVNPKCNCLTDPNMCKNYAFLQFVYNDQIDAESSMRLAKSYIFMYNSFYGAVDLDDLRVQLKEFFEFTPQLPI